MKQAQRQAYNRVSNVMIPNMYYRDDIGDRWSEEDSDRLHAWGYLREASSNKAGLASAGAYPFAHPAAVLPLARPMGRFAVPSALAIGSVAPRPLVLRARSSAARTSHSLAGAALVLPAGGPRWRTRCSICSSSSP